MEENLKKPEGFFDKDKLLVDIEMVNPFWEQSEQAINTHPFDDGRSVGYIRYIIKDTALILIDCVVTGKAK